MDSLCRICIKNDSEEMVSLFCAVKDEVIANMIIDCSDILITENDNLPTQVCKDCLYALENAYALRKKCRDSDVMLRKMIKGTENRNNVKKNIENIKFDKQQVKAESSRYSEPEAVVECENLLELMKNKNYTPKLKLLPTSMYNITLDDDLYSVVLLDGFRCCSCSKIFDTEDELHSHCRSAHILDKVEADASKPHECKTCFKRFPRHSNLQLHSNTAGIKELYHCKICDQLFEFKVRLQQHQKSHDIPKFMSFLENCGDAQAEDEDFNLRKTKAKPSDRKIKLPPLSKCDWVHKYDTYDHLKIKGMRCCGCHLIFDNRFDLIKHSREEHKKKKVDHDLSNPFECNICFDRFPTESKLRVHVKYSKFSELFHCKICNVVFDVKSSLIRHQNTNATHNENLAEGVFNFEYVEEVEVFLSEDDKLENMMCEDVQPEAEQEGEQEQEQELDEEQDEEEEEENISKVDGEEEEEEIADGEAAFIEMKKKYKKRSNQKRLQLPPLSKRESVQNFKLYDVIRVKGERCCGCNEILDTMEELQEHSLLNHTPMSITVDCNSIRCDVCFATFSQQRILTTHQNCRLQSELYYCKLCDVVFDLKSRFEQHVKVSALHRAYNSNDVSEETEILVEVDVDGETVKKEDFTDLDSGFDVIEVEGVRCCGCTEIFDNEDELRAHSFSVHLNDKTENTEKPFECNNCYRRFPKGGALTYHKNAGLLKILYRCKTCGVQFEFISRMRQHLAGNAHERENLKTSMQEKREREKGSKKAVVHHCCFIRCDSNFATAEELLQHTKVVHRIKRNQNTIDREGEDNVCENCCRNFRSYKSLFYHKSTQRHAQSYTSHICSTCGATRRSAKDLLQHEQLHTGDKPFSCDICNKRFVSKEVLKTHAVCHSDDKPFKCEYCGKQFGRKRNYKDHKRSHTNEKPYLCDLCPSAFRLPHSLVLHRRTHTGEKPYKCTYCENRYSHQTDKRRHEMASHTGEKPHKCQYCPSAFIRKRQLLIHERTHTGERPFVCSMCGKSFIQMSYLRKHMQMHGVYGTIKTDDPDVSVEVINEDDLEYDLVEVMEGESDVQYDPVVKYRVVSLT